MLSNVVYDSSSNGADSLNIFSVPYTFSQAYTAAPGADVWLAIILGGTVAPTSVTYNGIALARVTQLGAGNGSAGMGYLYKGKGLGTGSSANFTYAIPPTTWSYAAWGSYRNVVDWGVPVTTFGTSTSLSSGAVTLEYGQVALCFAFSYNTAGADGYVTTPGGGTQRSLGHTSTSYCSLAVEDSTTTATFTGTIQRRCRQAVEHDHGSPLAQHLGARLHGRGYVRPAVHVHLRAGHPHGPVARRSGSAPDMFGGYFDDAGYTCVDVCYPADIWPFTPGPPRWTRSSPRWVRDRSRRHNTRGIHRRRGSRSRHRDQSHLRARRSSADSARGDDRVAGADRTANRRRGPTCR